MKNLGILLSWITVKDLAAATRFYTEVAGFTVKENHPEFGWVELMGEKGARLGLSQESKELDIKAGANAITTITVQNLQESIAFFQKKGVKLLGDIQEVPGHVKLQMFADPDGNIMQLVEIL
jgi:predicted enzyme related to lactoylglutathione lyase